MHGALHGGTGRLAGCAPSVSCRKHGRVGHPEPHLASLILPSQRLQGQIDPDALVALHQWRAALRLAADQQGGRAKF